MTTQISILSEPDEMFPWQSATEDLYAAEEVVAKMYADAGLHRPKMAWAQSPRSMYGAIKMIREIQVGQRHNMVRALIPMGDPVETETKRVLLEAILDKDLTVTMGSNLRDRFASLFGSVAMPNPIRELAEVLRQSFTPPPQGKLNGAAGWGEWVAYPLNYVSPGWLQSQALVIAPFVKMCWMARPPLFVKVVEDHLHCIDGPAVRFADGYEVWAQYDFGDDRGSQFVTLDAGSSVGTKFLSSGSGADDAE